MYAQTSKQMINLNYINKKLRNKSPEEIVDWAMQLSNKRIVTTSFGLHSSAILHLVTEKDKDIDVIWCDTGYNTSETYAFAQNLIQNLDLHIHIYKPLLDKTTIETTFGLPYLNDPKFDMFKDTVKLEPFRRALQNHQPDIWFTNIRSGQTEFRDSVDIVSYSKEGILKISPFYYWNNIELDQYLEINNLPKNDNYFDITKVLSHRECGIHYQ